MGDDAKTTETTETSQSTDSNLSDELADLFGDPKKDDSKESSEEDSTDQLSEDEDETSDTEEKKEGEEKASSEEGEEENREEEADTEDGKTDADKSQRKKDDGESSSKGDDKDSQVASLLNRIEELTGQLSAPKETTQESSQAPKADEKPTVQSFDDLVKDIDMEELVSDKEKFVSLLRSVHQNAVETAIGSKTDLDNNQLLMKLPQIISSQVDYYVKISKLIETFYAENEDLVSVKKTVGHIADQVQSENPDWKPEQVFVEAGKRTRKMLGLKEAAQAKSRSSAPRTPSLPSKSSSSRKAKQTPGVKTISDEIDEMTNL